MITVKELIEKLQAFPPDWGVEVNELQWEYGGGDIISVEEAHTMDCDQYGSPFAKGLQVVIINFES